MTGLFSEFEQSKDHFYELDYQVMKHAFEFQKRMGRFHDEQAYQNELIHLLKKQGIVTESEVPLNINFSSFEKTYYIDLLIEGHHICELKALSDLTNQCRSQTINYLSISGFPYAKLINFGSRSVQHEFITNTLSQKDRRQLTFDTRNLDDESTAARTLFSLSRELLEDWGSRLDPSLYTEALMDLTPGSKQDRIQIFSEGRMIGSKLINLIAPGMALKTTTAKSPSPLKSQFQKFVNHTDLNSFIWINLSRSHVTYTTLRKNHPVI